MTKRITNVKLFYVEPLFDEVFVEMPDIDEALEGWIHVASVTKVIKTSCCSILQSDNGHLIKFNFTLIFQIISWPRVICL